MKCPSLPLPFLCALLLIGSLLWIPHGVQAVEVEVKGLGANRAEALLDAQKNAVEQGVGTLLDAKSVTENFEILESRVYSASHGYVRTFEVLHEGKQEGGIFEVTIKADVDDKKIVGDLRALRIWQKTHFDSRRVMMVYTIKMEDDLPADNEAVQAALGQLQDTFLAKQFRVFDDEQMEQINKDLAHSGRGFEDAELVRIAQRYKADFLIAFGASGEERPTEWGANNYLFSMQSKALEASTGRLCGTLRSAGESMAAGENAITALAKAAQQAAIKAADGLIQRLTTCSGTKEMMVVFHHFSEEEHDAIMDALEEMGIQDYREKSITSGYMELELFNDSSPTRFRRKMIKSARKMGVHLATQHCTSGRCVFKKKISRPVQPHIPEAVQ